MRHPCYTSFALCTLKIGCKDSSDALTPKSKRHVMKSCTCRLFSLHTSQCAIKGGHVPNEQDCKVNKRGRHKYNFEQTAFQVTCYKCTPVSHMDPEPYPSNRTLKTYAEPRCESSKYVNSRGFVWGNECSSLVSSIRAWNVSLPLQHTANPCSIPTRVRACSVYV